MIIELFPPLALHEKGKRDGNEDCIYPALLDYEQQLAARLFLVCDGVGGLEKGEEASRLACSTFSSSLGWKNGFGEPEILQALQETETAMDQYAERHPDSEGMATTLTMIGFQAKGVILAHIGDSRIYHIRHGKILFRTYDHSLVNDMVAQKILTPEEARHHPKRNIISRAISGRQRPTKPDVQLIENLRSGDYFFMCTDGVLESVSDDQLAQILGQTEMTDKGKLVQIFELCQASSRDNFSAYLLHIKSVTQDILDKKSTDFGQNKASGSSEKSKMPVWILSGVAVVSALLLIYLLVGKNNQVEPAASEENLTIDSTEFFQNADSLNQPINAAESAENTQMEDSTNTEKVILATENNQKIENLSKPIEKTKPPKSEIKRKSSIDSLRKMNQLVPMDSL